MTRKERSRQNVLLVFLALLAVGVTGHPAMAQSHGAPLSMEGVHQRTVHSAAAMGMGGLSLLVRDDAASMFQNPATLATLTGIQLSVGGVHRSATWRQEQHYAPVRYYPNLSLLLEGLTDQIPDPDPDLIGFMPRDSVQRPLDAISPNWTHAQAATAPLQGFVAVPVDLGAVRLVAGVGVAEYGTFDFYYQNNNALTPNVLSQRPLPTPRPTDDNPVEVDWYQVVRSRQGSVAGYGGAVALEWKRFNLDLGLSGTYLRGTTDDFEQDVARARLTFYANAFRVDSLPGHVSRQGQSEFSGFDVALSSALRGEHVSIGVTIRPAMTVTRSYTTDVTSDGVGLSVVSGEDRLSIPWRGSAGIALTPRDDLAFGLEYEIRPYANALLREAEGRERAPWMSSSAFRAGAEYTVLPWLALRGGMRREAETFGADGRALEDEPVWFTAYSAGAGAAIAGAQLNVAFENRAVRYQDIMGTAVHHNRATRQMFVVDLVYSFNRR
jgi:hypothetical protein